MSGKAKSNYLTVTHVVEGKHVTVLAKMFFNAGELNAFMKEYEILTRYPKTEYTIYKECY